MTKRATFEGRLTAHSAVGVRVIRISRLRGVLLEYRVGNDAPVKQWLRTRDELDLSLSLDVMP